MVSRYRLLTSSTQALHAHLSLVWPASVILSAAQATLGNVDPVASTVDAVCRIDSALSGSIYTAKRAIAGEFAASAQCAAMASEAKDAIKPAEGKPLGEKLRVPLEKSAEELNTLLPAGWISKCGLEKVTCAADGTTEWVLPQDVERFKEQGRALLGKESKAEKEASERAREHVSAQREDAQRRRVSAPHEDAQWRREVSPAAT